MKLISFCLVLLFLTVPVSAVDWFDSDWKNRRNITINHSMVDVEIVGFPVMVAITQLGLNVDGNDIRLTDSSGNQVAREIECYNETSGGLVFHFNGTSISNTSDTLFWMYYNNSAASEPAADSAYGSETVWDNNYVGVWHMNSVSSLINSVNGGSTTAYNTPTLEDGTYGKQITFTASSSQYIDVGDIDTSDTTLTYIASIDDATPSVYQGIITKFHPVAGKSSWLNWIGTDGKIRGIVTDGASKNVYSKVLSDGVEYIHTFTSENWGDVKFKTDSDSVITGNAVSTMQQSVTNILIGAYRMNDAPGTPDKFLDGDIGEVRLSNIIRSVNYQNLTHVNLNNPTAVGTYPFFLLFGEEESYEAPPQGTFLYPNSTYSIGYYGRLTSELVYETGINFSDIDTFNLLTSENMEYLSIDDTNYIPSIDKDAAHDGYMYGNFSLPGVETVNFINVKTVHYRNETNPVILGLFNVSTQKWHAVNNSSVEIVDVELTYNITGTDIAKYTTLTNNVLNLSVSLNTNGDGNYDVFVDFVEVYIDYEEAPDITLEYVYNLTMSNQNNISILQNDVDDLKNNVNNLYLFVLLCTVFLIATLRKRGDQ